MSPALRQLLIALLIVIALFFVARQVQNFPSFNNWFQPKPIVVDQTPLLVNEIKNIAQLMTVEAYNEVVVDSTRYPFGMPSKIFNTFRLPAASQLVLIVKGKVIAGVDLKNIDSNQVHVKGDTIFVQLPRAQVLDVITNPSDVETFIEEGKWEQSAATALQMKARNQLVKQALAQGVLPQADSKARSLVYELLKNLRYKAVIVTTAIQVNTPSGKQ